MYNEISFPEHEYESIQNFLKNLGYCYTTRVYKEVGKYKTGELYLAPCQFLSAENKKAEIICSINHFCVRNILIFRTNL